MDARLRSDWWTLAWQPDSGGFVLRDEVGTLRCEPTSDMAKIDHALREYKTVWTGTHRHPSGVAYRMINVTRRVDGCVVCLTALVPNGDEWTVAGVDHDHVLARCTRLWLAELPEHRLDVNDWLMMQRIEGEWSIEQLVEG